MQEAQVNQLIGHLFRHEAGKMAAVLTRLLGFQSLELAEDIVQDTLLKALSVWKIKGVPDNPSAWLYTVAKRKAIDVIRKNRLQAQHYESIHEALRSEWTLTPTINTLFLEDDLLANGNKPKYHLLQLVDCRHKPKAKWRDAKGGSFFLEEISSII